MASKKGKNKSKIEKYISKLYSCYETVMFLKNSSPHNEVYIKGANN